MAFSRYHLRVGTHGFERGFRCYVDLHFECVAVPYVTTISTPTLSSNIPRVYSVRYRYSLYRYGCRTDFTEVSGTGIDVSYLPNCPVSVLMYLNYRSVRYRYESLYRYRRYRY